jgi:GxxExxY protein
MPEVFLTAETRRRREERERKKMKTAAEINALTEIIIAAAIEVHRALGPGLLESAYEQCLCHELNLRGISFQPQHDLPVIYKGIRLDCGYRIDILVENTIVLEIKAVDQLHPIHDAQLITYLKLGNWPVGLILNFNVGALKDGIRRRVNNLTE